MHEKITVWALDIIIGKDFVIS